MRNGLIRLSGPAIGRAALCVAACFGAAGSAAAPQLPKVVAGQASFSQDGNVFSITNTPGTIINWQSFSVNAGEITRFIQQNSDSAVLNRIVGQDPSRILGALQSNGKVFLINPNGVVFGQGARVDVNGLVASTLNMSDADFLAGKKNFTAGPSAGAVRNEGAITTPSGGKVFLVAPNVENSGVITAPNGEVVLAAGRSVQLLDSANPDLTVLVSAPTDQAINLGQVVANGGRIGIYGALVNQRGVVNANSAVVGQDGRIVLKASRDTVLEQGSLTSATGAGKGGEIQLLGERVGLAGNAQVDASGALGGGTVLVGGDYQGKNAALPNAQQTWFGQDARIRADATASGTGGKVVLWSDGATAAWGSISARGAGTGNGGLVETSGKELDIDGIRVDAGGGQGGMTGTWLLDPWNIVVAADGTAKASDVNVFSKLPGTDTTRVSAKTLLETNADIVLQARNDLTISESIVTPHSLRAEAGHDLSVGASITSTGGSIDLRAGNQISLNAGSALHSANYIDLKAERMALAGMIGGVGGVDPVVSFNTFNNGTSIFVLGNPVNNALTLDPTRLGAFNAYEINIGNSGHTGQVVIGSALNLNSNLLIDTRGSIDINAPVRLSSATSQFLATQHGPGYFQVAREGSIDAGRRIGVAGASRIAIDGRLSSGEIDLAAGSGGITLTADVTGNSRVTLRTDGALQQGSSSVRTPGLLVEANSVHMMGANQVGTLAGSATGTAAGAGLRFGWSGELRIGRVGESAGLSSQSDITLTGGNLAVDETLDAPVAIVVEAASIKGAGTLKSNVLSLQSRGGIGEATRPLRTSTNVLMNATSTGPGNAPINIVNDRVLTVGKAAQEGAGNGGAISIESTGGLTVGSGGVTTGSGDIRLVTHSPLNINGRVATDSGNITLFADNKGLLTIGEGGKVASNSGSVQITAGDTVMPANAIETAPGKLSVTKTNAPQDPQPDLPPPLDSCLNNPNAAGCVKVLEDATRACIVNPEGPQCGRVLPLPQSCRENPDKLGCGVVAVRECIATPKAPSCIGVLPTYATCEKSPGTYGCAPVVAEHDKVESCILTPKAPSCLGVLPVYETCAAAPSTHGCGPALAERAAIAACIAAPNAPGCGEILPPLATCRLDAGVYGCTPVLDRAAFQACLVNPTGSGCAARLPALAVCKATPNIEGCAQVLQVTFDACLVNKADPSCLGILPTIAQCESNKALAGCSVVLPSMQQCILNPAQPGCAAQLPKLEQCALNPNLAGCEAVLPKPDFCATHPTDPRCAIFNPGSGQSSEAKKPVAEAVQNTVTLMNTTTPSQAKLPAGTREGSSNAGGEGGGAAPSEQSENAAGPAAATNTGAKNVKPATKMYCN